MDRQLAVDWVMTSEDYLDALLALPSAERPKVSWDGRWVAWVWYGVGEAADVYAAPLDGSRPPIRMTASGEDTFLVSWTPDSRAVLVTQDVGGDERAQLFRIDLDHPQAMIPLTDPAPNYYLRGGELHPNGRWLVYGANADFTTGQEIEPTWVYRQDLQSGERRILARPQKAGMVWPELNASGTHILYSRNDEHPAGRQVWLVDIEGRQDREILNVGPDRKAFAFWFPDGERALVLAESGTHRRLGVWELGSGETRWLLDDPNRNIEAAYAPVGAREIVVVESHAARLHASLLDWQTGVERPVPEVPGNLVPIAPADGDTWLGLYFCARQPTDLVRFPLADPRPERHSSLTRVWEMTDLKPDDLTPAEDFRWRSADGLEIQGWLYRTPRPLRGTIVLVHGGPTDHTMDWLDAEIQFFVHQGFHVLDPNYRGSTGFSLAYREAIKQDGWGGREQDDIRTGIQALIERGIAEPGKIGITGTSYGGYSSWWAITHLTADLAAAAAPVCGMTDLVIDYDTTRPDLRPYTAEMMGGTPDQSPERYRERSPIHFVDRIRGRLLIVQGLRDPNVTPENVRSVITALQRCGIPYELLAFDDEGHGITKPKNQRVLYLRLAQFFSVAFADGIPPA